MKVIVRQKMKELPPILTRVFEDFATVVDHNSYVEAVARYHSLEMIHFEFPQMRQTF